MIHKDAGFREFLTRLAWPVLLLAILAFHVWSLMRYPSPFVDEAWVGARAWNFLATGQAFGDLDHGVFDQFEGYWTFFPFLPTVFFAGGMRWFAQPSLLGIRMVSFGSGLLLLGAIYLIARSVGGVRCGKLSVLIASLSLAFQYSSHLGRYDIFTATLGFWGLALHFVNGSRNLWVSLLSGLFIGLAFETHAHGAIYIPVILTLFLYQFRWGSFREGHFWSMLLGLSVGLLVYVGLHVLPSPRGFLAFNQVVYSPTHTPPLLTFSPSIMVDGLADLLRLLSETHLIALLFVPLLFWDLSTSDEPDLRRLPIMVISLALAHALLIRTKLPYYAILITPAIDVSLAVFLLRLFEKHWIRRGVHTIARALVTGVMLVSPARILGLAASNGSMNFDHVQSRLSQEILPGDTVMGSQIYWFGLYDNAYLSWENLIYFKRMNEGSDLEAAFKAFRPDVLILDQHWQEYISDGLAGEVYFQSLRLSRSEFDRFLAGMNADLLTTINDQQYGPILVYRLHW